MEKEEFAARLRRIRAARGLSQKELSDLSGITMGHISHLETGKRSERNLAVRTLGKLSKALGITWQELQLGVRDDD